ncbi:MAG: bifunctional 4-hydroxy-2-oxoglutarate aldolase/2-dehydro-3-deoxy-phosphogluconate aldolase, partial [Anaerolineae bacterium]|nr:bifunctional 4-hydroxy-2-oxoglutarate aldolase/2-dehydro-3-deoxy-phosphogluconate aldolase [Anaerolineae bacterium]
MSKDHILERILDNRIIAVVRLDTSAQLLQVARAIRAGGVEVIEFTMTTPDALSMIEETGRTLGDDVLLGAGTVLDARTARLAMAAGARFLVSPTLNRETIETCHRFDVVAIPGALTPTEIFTAWEWGADLVKVFPARLGGPEYISDLLAPLPQLRLVPTGGVGPSNARQFIQAG